VAGRAELAVGAGGGDLAEHVFVEVALGVALVHGDFIDDVDDFFQQPGVGDGESGILHVLGVGGFLAVGQLNQPGAQEREDVLGEDGVHLVAGEVLELAPAEVLVRAALLVQTAGKTGFSTGLPVRLALFSARVWFSSRRFRKSRYVICSITSSGLEMPPVQNAFQTLST
jgi:hypothetical protein